nr:hypothetical protein [uncultured Deefgea sp.]
MSMLLADLEDACNNEDKETAKFIIDDIHESEPDNSEEAMHMYEEAFYSEQDF